MESGHQRDIGNMMLQLHIILQLDSEPLIEITHDPVYIQHIEQLEQLPHTCAHLYMIAEQLIIFNYVCVLSQAACRAGMRPSPLTQWNWMKALAMSASMSVTYTGLLCSVQSSLKDLRIQMLWASPPPWWKALCLCNSATLFSQYKTTTQWNSRELIDATVISWYSLGCSAFSLVFTAGFTTSDAAASSDPERRCTSDHRRSTAWPHIACSPAAALASSSPTSSVQAGCALVFCWCAI